MDNSSRRRLSTWNPSIGFLHKLADYQTKQSLMYDLQESFRWISDVAVAEAFESGVLDLPDFYFTGNDYRYHFETEAKRRFLELLKERFDVSIRYKGRALKWDTVIEQKTVELGRYLAGRTSQLNFSDPSPNLTRTDDRELRRRILSLSQPDARRLGIGRSTLHYLRKNAKSIDSLRTYQKVSDRVKPLTVSTSIGRVR